MIQGNLLQIRINGEVIANSVSTSLSFTNSLVEVTTNPTDGYAEYITGRKGATISFSGLLSSVKLFDGEDVDVVFVMDTQGYFCRGTFTGSSITGETDAATQYEGQLKVSGELTLSSAVFLEDLTINSIPVEIGGVQVQVRT